VPAGIAKSIITVAAALTCGPGKPGLNLSTWRLTIPITSMGRIKDSGTGRSATRSWVWWRKEFLSEDRWKELVAGMTAADNSPDTVVAHCRMHQLIAKKPRT